MKKKLLLCIVLASLLLLTATAYAAIKDCEACGGTGKTVTATCTVCNGSCKEVCTTCWGSGMKRCGGCNGSGFESNDPCYRCGGTGTTTSGKCRLCNGMGYPPCIHCWGSGYDNIPCLSCQGSKEQSCTGCNGTGKVQAVCDICGGSGKIDECKDGHLFTGAEVSYKWNDGSCTAERCCVREGCAAKETETKGKYVKETDATCAEPERGHYEAAFENGAFKTQKSESFTVGEALGHEPGEWKTVRKATTEVEGKKAIKCLVCGRTLKSRSIAKLPKSAEESPEDGEKKESSYLSVNGNAVSQILTLKDSGKKILTVMPDPEENLSENDTLVLSLTMDDILGFSADGIQTVRLVSIGELAETVIGIDELKASLEASGADKAEVLVVSAAPGSEETQIALPEGMTQASAMSYITVKAYGNGETAEVDPALFTAVKVNAALSNANNDIVGLFRALPEDNFTEIAAEYVFDEETNAGSWKVPMQGNGYYLMAEKAA